MGLWNRKNRKLSDKQRDFARATAHHALEIGYLRRMKSWEEVLAKGMLDLEKWGIKILYKKKGRITRNRWDARPTMGPLATGPLMLPWNWDQRSERRRARVLWHENTHRSQDNALLAYELMYVNAAWRWAIETNAFGQEVWIMVMSDVNGLDKAYTEKAIELWIARRAKKMAKSYRLRGFRRGHIEDATREALMHHMRAARKELNRLE